MSVTLENIQFKFAEGFVPYTENIIGSWKFEEASGDAIDDINSNDATMSNATYRQTGQVNYCYSFNGTTAYGNIGQPAVLNINPKDDPISIVAWVKSNAATGYIISKGNSDGATRQYNMYCDGVYLECNMSGGSWTTISDTVLANNVWHLVVLTSPGDGNVGHAYIDGILQATTIPMGSAIANSVDILIGARRDTGNIGVTIYFTGSIDELRIYDIELNQVQITAIYNDEI